MSCPFQPNPNIPPECVVGIGVTPPNQPPSPYTTYGLYATRIVSAATLQAPTDVIYNTMHLGDYNHNWTEIGWQLSSGSVCPGGGFQLYAYNSDLPPQQQWACGGTGSSAIFPIGPGSTIFVSIQSSGAPYNQWYDYVYWNSTWYLMANSTLATPYATGVDDPNLTSEIYTWATNTANYPTLPHTESNSVEIETGLGGPWIYWDNSVPDSGVLWDTYPYGLGVYDEWYWWWACGPLDVISC